MTHPTGVIEDKVHLINTLDEFPDIWKLYSNAAPITSGIDSKLFAVVVDTAAEALHKAYPDKSDLGLACGEDQQAVISELCGVLNIDAIDITGMTIGHFTVLKSSLKKLISQRS